MDFIDQIKLLSKRVEQIKEQIQTEEATKMSLIMPLFQALGYDVFNPMEFVPEYVADVGIKKVKSRLCYFNRWRTNYISGSQMVW